MVYQSQYKSIGIGSIIVELTRRVNDFKTVYLERKYENVCVHDNRDGEFLQRRRKVAKLLEVLGRSTQLYFVVPFLCPFLCLTLTLSHISFGVVPISLVVALVSTSTL